MELSGGGTHVIIFIMGYNFTEIEASWKQFYRENKTFTRAPTIPYDSKKFYCLEMFPYPSGDLHIGHARNYTIGDVIARTRKLQGYQVLHPIGWDAFGLPAENAAIERKARPKEWTFNNIDRMREQLHDLGFSYDWDHEVCTAKEDYYHWGQWLFLQLYKQGLVYRKKAPVFWDPIDKTVLAKEQVQDGMAWRSGAVVERKEIEQWYIRITDYAEELLNNLDKMNGWPERVKTMQKHWIGKSEGVIIHFRCGERIFPIFTTRPDTIFGVSFMAIAFDHEDLFDYVKGDEAHVEKIRDFVEDCKKLDQHSDYQKEGLKIGTTIIHPFTGAQIPLYVTNFVLAEYGTGTIMGVPAHDVRDFDFARKYNLSILPVISPPEKSRGLDEAYTGSGVLINSKEFDGLPNQEAITKIIAYIENKKLGERKVQYKLKDWLISRQRYWGNPIPMLKTPSGDYFPEDEENLPVILPDLPFTGTRNPLMDHDPFVKVERGKEVWQREIDTMDTFTCSSWYFLRFIDPMNEKVPFSEEAARYWLPIDQYIGGIEHACMHLLYARFFHKALRDLGMVFTDEPFQNLLTQGMVVGPSYFSPSLKKYYASSELQGDKKTCPETGVPLVIKMEKMSKSKNNGVDPREMVTQYGADSIRLFIMFAAPPEKDLEWNEGGIEGCQRFLLKIYRWAELIFSTYLEKSSEPDDGGLTKSLDITIAKVESDIEKFHFNTAIAALMTFINQAVIVRKDELQNPKLWEEHARCLKKFLIILSPFAPFLAEELNHRLSQVRDPSHKRISISQESWPTFDPQSLIRDNVEIAIQVNGKLRGRIELPADTPNTKVVEVARKETHVINYLEGKKTIREIVIPNRLINFVVK